MHMFSSFLLNSIGQVNLTFNLKALFTFFNEFIFNGFIYLLNTAIGK